MNTTFKLIASAAEQDHLAARAAQAIGECVALPDIETCELEALHDAVEFELQDRDHAITQIIGQPF